MKPLIKWAGGKSNEIKYVEKIIPPYKRYIEPFFGGGALFFDLEPPKKAIINDISGELMTFYRLLKNGDSGKKFKRELYNYVHHWKRIDVYMKEFGNDFLDLYKRYRDEKIDYEQLKEEFRILFKDRIIPFNGLFRRNFCVNRQGLLEEIESNLLAKFKRTKEKVDVKKKFSDKEIKMNIETGFRGGFYTHFRDVMNEAKLGSIKISREKEIANWYFVREFCYGGMFRFSQKGEFNVPYGGIAYNTKDFEKKVDYIFSKEVRALLDRTTTENEDFETLLNSLKLTEDDFIFLDPPYDTEFSEYEENPFDKKDQERLAETLINTKAKWILIIKETDFIRDLYTTPEAKKKGVKYEKFKKEYLFNIRSRFVRKVHHLMIHNLNIPQEKQKELFALF